jgi:MFS family permease
VYGLDPEARSRLNAVLFVGMFAGMATGAGLGGVLLAKWGWAAVTALATLTSVAALLLRLGSDGARAGRWGAAATTPPTAEALTRPVGLRCAIRPRIAPKPAQPVRPPASG